MSDSAERKILSKKRVSLRSIITSDNHIITFHISFLIKRLSFWSDWNPSPSNLQSKPPNSDLLDKNNDFLQLSSSLEWHWIYDVANGSDVDAFAKLDKLTKGLRENSWEKIHTADSWSRKHYGWIMTKWLYQRTNTFWLAKLVVSFWLALKCTAADSAMWTGMRFCELQGQAIHRQEKSCNIQVMNRAIG